MLEASDPKRGRRPGGGTRPELSRLATPRLRMGTILFVSSPPSRLWPLIVHAPDEEEELTVRKSTVLANSQRFPVTDGAACVFPAMLGFVFILTALVDQKSRGLLGYWRQNPQFISSVQQEIPEN
ncbi:hypothetical protein RchiOBHm_Chr5g0042821 [Rosa chinensis]|uniref:Uncharacterized protein n=1 Tax=Rosa chinensis TaxID=74649 RepID=A0A2P6QD73_ROSCH|nr:hypothetical protein RchiOBHm_Chr5g0042821 [Rosa chinensis]